MTARTFGQFEIVRGAAQERLDAFQNGFNGRLQSPLVDRRSSKASLLWPAD
jgi:hypothetical protein